MKSSMTSFDVLAVVGELKDLKGARLNKVYQVTQQELKAVMNIKGFGKRELVVEAGKRLHLTEYPKPNPDTPSVFAMTIRKHLGNAVLEDVLQVAFDRIVELRFRRGGEGYILIAELFGKGNVLLTREDYTILAVMKPQRFKGRALVGRETYSLPPKRLNPLEISKEELLKTVSESKSDLVRTTASMLGLGGLYAEEVCLRAEVEKGKDAINDEEAKRLVKALDDLKNEIGREGFIVIDEKPVDVVPHRLQKYAEKEWKAFPSFNQALDEYYTKYEIKRIEGIKEERYEKELGLYELRLKEQREALRKFNLEGERYREIGDHIYAEFNQVEDILRALTEAKRSLGWKEIVQRIENGKGQVNQADLIKKVLPKEGALVLSIKGLEVRLSINKTAARNAEVYYNKGKKARDKALGVEKAILETEAKIREIKEKGKKAVVLQEKKPKKKVKKKKEWFEKFRWFYSSDGFLILGGRDATSNEVLVKRHMEDEDVFVHAAVQGAPSVIIKTEGKSLPETTISEAYDFAASYSKAWKHGLAAVDAYWVKPEQVSKRAEHGEYLAKGAFVIRGKKNLGKGSVELGVSASITGGEPTVMAAPLSALKTAKCWVKLVPGRLKSKEAAEKIKALLIEEADKEDKERVNEIPLEDFQVLLPPGGCEVLRRS